MNRRELLTSTTAAILLSAGFLGTGTVSGATREDIWWERKQQGMTMIVFLHIKDKFRVSSSINANEYTVDTERHMVQENLRIYYLYCATIPKKDRWEDYKYAKASAEDYFGIKLD